MSLIFAPIEYKRLNARQKENYNYQKLSAVLADYGYVTMRLSDDWQGADLIAQHINGEFLKIQLKGRLTFCKKYVGKSIYVAFRYKKVWYIYPHDELLKKLDERYEIRNSLSWAKDSEIKYGKPTKPLFRILAPYLIEDPQLKLPLQGGNS